MIMITRNKHTNRLKIAQSVGGNESSNEMKAKLNFGQSEFFSDTLCTLFFILLQRKSSGVKKRANLNPNEALWVTEKHQSY